MGDILPKPLWQACFDSAGFQGYLASMKPWHVYLLRCADDTLYCGITTDPERRLREHNDGTGAKYTRSRRPVSMLESIMVETRSAALKLEAAVKKRPKAAKQDFLMNGGL